MPRVKYRRNIGVVVGAALPGTLRIAEDLHIRGYRKVFVFRHPQSAVPCQRDNRTSATRAFVREN